MFREGVVEFIDKSFRAGVSAMTHLSRLRALALVLSVALLAGCEPSPEEALGRILLSHNTEEIHRLVADLYGHGEEAIPVYLAILNRRVEQGGSPCELTKSGRTLEYLMKLAQDGIYTVDEVPVLLRVIDDHKHVLFVNTIWPAETLRIITGVDVGWDAAFIENYTEADEPKRQAMLDEWRQWYAEN